METFAEEICNKLNDMLKHSKEVNGEIHSVFSRVFNITFPGWPIVSIISKNIPMKPMSVSLQPLVNKSMYDLGLESEQTVKYHKDRFEIPEAGFIMYLNNPATFDCTPYFDSNKVAVSEVESNIRELGLIIEQGNPLGLLPVVYNFDFALEEHGISIPQNRYSEFAWPKINKLISALSQGSLMEITKSSREISGFGPGLTPSSDDFLAGLMISLIYAFHYYNWNREKVEFINTAILKGAEGRTTRLSYEMMSFASKGEVTKSIHQLMNCIYFNTKQPMYRNVLDVMDYGETSGTDLVSGIYIGCKICSQIKSL